MSASFTKLPLLFLVLPSLFLACGSPLPEEHNGIVGTQDAGGSSGDGLGADQFGGALAGVELCPELNAELPAWPIQAPKSAPCKPLFAQFALPTLAASAGAIELIPSAFLQPLGYEEALTIKLRHKPGGSTDKGFAGAVKLQLSAGVELISCPPLVQGRGEAIVRVTKAGPQSIEATLPGDPRQGSVALYGYPTHLPVMEMEIAAEDLKAMIDQPFETLWKKTTLTVDGVPYTGKVRLHGGSSREHPKKSFRFNLDDYKGIDGHRKIVLRAEWSDRTLLRNWLGLEVFRWGTWLLVSKARFVHLRINRSYYGVMLNVERVDKDFLRARGMSEEGSLYEADPLQDFGQPGGNLTPLPDHEAYEKVYQQHAGSLDYSDLIELIEIVLQLKDALITKVLDRVVRVDDALVYFATMAALQNQDFVRKNSYLYRDPDAEDCRWRLIPWDLDLCLGRLWTEKNDILDDQIFTDGDIWVGSYKGYSFYNKLADRLMTLPPWRARFLGFLEHLMAYPFNESFFDLRIDTAVCQMQGDLLADKRKRSDNADYPKRIEELRAFVKARRAFVLSTIEAESSKP